MFDVYVVADDGEWVLMNDEDGSFGTEEEARRWAQSHLASNMHFRVQAHDGNQASK